MPAHAPQSTHRHSPDYADRVNLIKKVKVGNAWRFATVVPEPNGKLRDRVQVNGAVEVHPEGSYFEWREGGRRCRSTVPKDEALDHARRKAVELRAIREGLIAAPEAVPQAPAKIPSGKAIDDYLRFVRAHRKERTYTTYRFTLDTCCAPPTRRNISRTRPARMCSTS